MSKRNNNNMYPAPRLNWHKGGLDPSILKGLSQEWSCPKNGPVPRVGLSQEWACPKGLSQEWACPKSGPVPINGVPVRKRKFPNEHAFYEFFDRVYNIALNNKAGQIGLSKSSRFQRCCDFSSPQPSKVILFGTVWGAGVSLVIDSGV